MLTAIAYSYSLQP